MVPALTPGAGRDLGIGEAAGDGWYDTVARRTPLSPVLRDMTGRGPVAVPARTPGLTVRAGDCMRSGRPPWASSSAGSPSPPRASLRAQGGRRHARVVPGPGW